VDLCDVLALARRPERRLIAREEGREQLLLLGGDQVERRLDLAARLAGEALRLDEAVADRRDLTDGARDRVARTAGGDHHDLGRVLSAHTLVRGAPELSARCEVRELRVDACGALGEVGLPPVDASSELGPEALDAQQRVEPGAACQLLEQRLLALARLEARGLDPILERLDAAELFALRAQGGEGLLLLARPRADLADRNRGGCRGRGLGFLRACRERAHDTEGDREGGDPGWGRARSHAGSKWSARPGV
jgi:hypothetical protein